MPGVIALPQLPFVTREMLKFGNKAEIEIRLTTQCDAAVKVTLAGLTREGVFSFNQTTTNNSIIKRDNFRVSDLPIAISVTDPDGVLAQGQCFARCALLINGNVIHELVSGWVYTQKALSWPGGTNADLRPGGGLITTETSADPAAGAELTITVPSGEIWQVLGCQAQLVADATSISRLPHFEFTNSVGLMLSAFPSDSQSASETRNYSVVAQPATLDNNSGTHTTVYIPENIWLEPTSTVTTATLNIHAGDNWGVMTVNIERFFTPA